LVVIHKSYLVECTSLMHPACHGSIMSHKQLMIR
jgi:fatty acid desaturase